MYGWLSAEAARASRSRRETRAGSRASATGSVLRATSRPRRVSRARYTSPMPPAASSEHTSYGPSRAPGSSRGRGGCGGPETPAGSVGIRSRASARISDSTAPRSTASSPQASATKRSRSSGSRSSAEARTSLTRRHRSGVTAAPPRRGGAGAGARPAPSATRGKPATAAETRRTDTVRWLESIPAADLGGGRGLIRA